MNRSGIPASITLAQGILESGNGKSELARVNQTIILVSNATALGPVNVSITTMMRKGNVSQIRQRAPQL
jgi:flagellum-specific peptidoglycan hydrolase FlgJ